MSTDLDPQNSPATFYGKFFTDSRLFAEAILLQIPELQTVTIIPTWVGEIEIRLQALQRGRHGTVTTATEHMQIIHKLTTLLRGQLERLQAYTLDFDKQLQEAINVRRNELNELDAALQARRAVEGGDSASGGDPGAPAGQGGDS